MTHNEVLQKFKQIFQIEDEDIDCWYPNGKGSVRVRSAAYGEMIFTYKNKKVWKIESVESYLESIKVEV